MSDFGNKEVFSENLNRYVASSGKTRRDICNDLGFKESSFNGWCRGEYYPRIDKIEMMSDYFGCTKSDLIEKQTDTYIATKAMKDVLETINMSRTKKHILEYVVKCSDAELGVLEAMINALEGKENEQSN